MQKLLGCFGIIIIIGLIIAIVSWIFSNIIGILGIAVAGWGAYAWNKNKQAGRNPKIPRIITIVGILLAIGWFSFTGDELEVTNEPKGPTEKVANVSVTDDKKEEEKKAKKVVAVEQEAEQAKQDVIEKEKETAASLGLVAVTVSRVVDGDTIELSDGSKVRLIGVNTPESTTRHEDYGKEASNYTKSKLDGKQVWVQKDISETDRYDRLLRLIWLAIPTDVMNEDEIRTKMFNADLVLNGYAEPSTYTPDVKYSDFFVKFAREAREKNTGLWAFGENGTTKGDLDIKQETTSTPTPAPTPTPSPEASTTTETEYFSNCTELRTKYPNGVPYGHAAYDSSMDRDHDNFACER